MKPVPASLALLMLHQEADRTGDDRYRISPATLRQWVKRGHITRGTGGYDLAEITAYLDRPVAIGQRVRLPPDQRTCPAVRGRSYPRNRVAGITARTGTPDPSITDAAASDDHSLATFNPSMNTGHTPSRTFHLVEWCRSRHGLIATGLGMVRSRPNFPHFPGGKNGTPPMGCGCADTRLSGPVRQPPQLGGARETRPDSPHGTGQPCHHEVCRHAARASPWPVPLKKSSLLVKPRIDTR
jgi:hypothetical protein